jgi:hypothetical protein
VSLIFYFDRAVGFYILQVVSNFIFLSSYSQSNPIGMNSTRQSIDFKGYGLLAFFVKGPKSIVFRSADVHINFVIPIEELLNLAL